MENGLAWAAGEVPLHVWHDHISEQARIVMMENLLRLISPCDDLIDSLRSRRGGGGERFYHVVIELRRLLDKDDIIQTLLSESGMVLGNMITEADLPDAFPVEIVPSIHVFGVGRKALLYEGPMLAKGDKQWVKRHLELTRASEDLLGLYNCGSEVGDLWDALGNMDR
jgi:hypothetical protein